MPTSTNWDPLDGTSTRAAGNTREQEEFISSLSTAGALNDNSGFDRSFAPGETNEQYAARLEAWKLANPEGPTGVDADNDDGSYDPSGDDPHTPGDFGLGGEMPDSPDPSYQTESLRDQWESQKGSYGNLLGDMYGGTDAANTQNTERNTSLYDTLMGRANQSLNIGRNDPIIRAQADAYSANEERARRNYVSDAAERYGPLANIRGEERMAAERAGQRSGAFEAELMGRELTARRAEIASALQGMQGMLNADQTRQLQQQLGLIDQAIRQQELGLGGQQLDASWQMGLRSQDIDVMRALLANEQFRASLGLQAENQYNMWNDPWSPYAQF